MVLLRHKIFECNQIFNGSFCFVFSHLIGSGMPELCWTTFWWVWADKTLHVFPCIKTGTEKQNVGMRFKQMLSWRSWLETTAWSVNDLGDLRLYSWLWVWFSVRSSVEPAWFCHSFASHCKQSRLGVTTGFLGVWQSETPSYYLKHTEFSWRVWFLSQFFINCHRNLIAKEQTAKNWNESIWRVGKEGQFYL